MANLARTATLIWRRSFGATALPISSLLNTIRAPRLRGAIHSTAIARRPEAGFPPKQLLPEFSLRDKVIVVSGGARGLGLVQAEALLEAGARGRLLRSIWVGES
jgi:hypothetical protein